MCHAGQDGASTLAMNVDTVDKVLDDVRPYLIADGGNVEVADVTDGVVLLRLQVMAARLGVYSS